MSEVSIIAESAGYGDPAGSELIKWQLDRARRRTLKNAVEPSMMADALNGRDMEVEAIIGNAVRLAENGGVGDRIPILRTVYMLSTGLNGSQWR